MQSLKTHSDFINSVTFSPDGKLIASGSSDQAIKIWNTATSDLQLILEGHIGPVHSVTFSSHDVSLASLSQQVISIWNTATSDLQQILDRYSGDVGSIAFSSFYDWLASCDLNETIKF